MGERGGSDCISSIEKLELKICYWLLKTESAIANFAGNRTHCEKLAAWNIRTEFRYFLSYALTLHFSCIVGSASHDFFVVAGHELVSGSVSYLPVADFR